MLDASVGLYNAQVSISGGLTPAIIGAMRGDLDGYGLPISTVWMSSVYWQDIMSNPAWLNMNPVDSYELFQTGYLGNVYGLYIRSEAFKSPFQRVLNRGEMYMLAAPQFLGAYTERGPLQVEEYKRPGTPGRGWDFQELLSMSIVNARGVTKAVRL